LVATTQLGSYYTVW